MAKDELAPCPLTYSLRNCAQWYPDVPPADAFVNDDSFPLTQRHKTKYRPLFLSAFGGEKGSLLHKLARVSVTTGDAVYGIQFGYSDGRTADLGGCRVDDLGRYRSGGGGAGDVGNTLTKGFDIDGAGGEIICAVVLFLERPRELWEMQGTAFTRMMGIEVSFVSPCLHQSLFLDIYIYIYLFDLVVRGWINDANGEDSLLQILDSQGCSSPRHRTPRTLSRWISSTRPALPLPASTEPK